MTKQFYRYTVLFLLTCFSISVTATAQTVNIPDPNLRAAIERELGVASGDTITTADMANLTRLVAPNADISDLTGLEGATNLTDLDLGTEQVQQRVWRNNNSITDISALQGLTKLEVLDLERNSITDISTVAGLTNLTELYLRNNLISDISPLAGLNKLTTLNLDFNGISNISSLADLTNLEILTLTYNNISDISPLAGLNQLVLLGLTHNSISDLLPLVANRGLGSGNFVDVSVNPLNFASINTHIPALQRRGVDVRSDAVIAEPVDIPDPNLRAAIERGLGVASGTTITTADMENLTRLAALNANISNLTGLEGATNLTLLNLGGNSIADISPLAKLTRLTELRLDDNSISDISPLVANTGLGNGDEVNLNKNPLSNQSLNTHIPTLQSRGVKVLFDDLRPTRSEYTLSIPAGISLIHVPLAVTEVDGREQTIESISDLYDALGGTSTVTFLITYDPRDQEWYSYFGRSGTGTFADRRLTDDMGIIVGLAAPVSVHLRGMALGTNASSTITLNQGLNVLGLPLNDSRIMRVSDLSAIDGIRGNVPVIILTDGGESKLVGRAGDPGDIAITGGQAFIMTASQAAIVEIFGDGWAND